MAKHVINNPGGRKPLPEDEVLGTSVTIRFTAKQMKRINRKRGDMPLRPYIREATVKGVVRPAISKTQWKEIRDLNNLGTNMNTLAKAARTSGFAAIADKCDKGATEICRIIHDVRTKIKSKEVEDTSLLQG
ncbi:MAG: hypothetical protein MJY71_02295 [Bacteroidaceae bacterium]|nr:hypothetical protein [Bacteroidaceae bacterium]